VKVAFNVRPDLSRWTCDHGTFEPFVRHEVDANEAFVAQIESAHNQGSLVDVEYDAAAKKVAKDAIESDEESAKKLIAAQQDGTWYEGNLMQHELNVAALAEGEAGVETGGEE